MGEDALEKVMVGFWEKEFDVLVCTTIVESGIDIPNANTLIVERADLLGLAQLHQIRGRVGRGRERAYAYFLYPPDRPLTEHAHERLATIAQHTELGAGMYVAMKDLEIRGAGNLLGGEQSGPHRGRRLRPVRADGRRGGAAVQGRGAAEEAVDVKIDLPVDAHLPHEYIGGRAAAAGDVPQDGRGKDARAAGRGRGRDARPVRRAARAGRQPVRGGPVPAARPGPRPHRRLAAGPARPVRADAAAGLQAAAAQAHYPDAVYKAVTDQVSVPRPTTQRVGGEPLRDTPLLTWCQDPSPQSLPDHGAAAPL